jgi:uncharacterized protein involved in exopolysaccharide biosynthesis/CO dehydrogenase nickel-insertion accessory protein CooC1
MRDGELDAIRDDFEREGSGGVDPVALVWGALRDRLILAIGLAVVLAGALGAAGFVYGKRSLAYESTGLVRIVPSKPVLLYETEFNERMPSYESFRNSQARLMQSQQVVDWAVRDEKLRELGWPNGAAGIRRLSSALSVRVPRQEEWIVVSVVHKDPGVAREAVNAVLRAYQRLSGDQASRQFTSMEGELARLRDQYRRDRDDAREQVRRLAEQHGTDNLERSLELKRDELQRLEALIYQAEREVALRSSSGGSDAESAEDGASELSVAALKAFDAELAELSSRLKDAEMSLEVASTRFGERHPNYVRAADRVAVLEGRVNARAEQVREAIASGETGDLVASSGSGMSTADLETRLDLLREQAGDLRSEVLDLGRTQLRIDLFQEQAEEADQQLKKAERRLEAIRVENRDREVGRVEIAQYGETALQPARDNRVKFGAAGAFFGFASGIGLVALPGILRPSYRTVGHVSVGETRFMLLGVLPEFEDGDEWAEDSERTSILRSNLQQMRGVLEASIPAPGEGGVAIAITSAGAAEGKTAFTLALGTAYARSGRRVAMVDADLVGRGLSDRCGCDGADDGLLGYLNGGGDCPARSTSVANLSVVPVGAGADGGPGSEAIGMAEMRALLAHLKGRFDVVLVDTGPVLGSHEAAAAAASADSSVLVISRGQSQAMVKAARERLGRLGVSDAHIVFNRASWSDLNKYPGSVTSRSVSARRDGAARRGSMPRALAVTATGGSDDQG